MRRLRRQKKGKEQGPSGLKRKAEEEGDKEAKREKEQASSSGDRVHGAKRKAEDIQEGDLDLGVDFFPSFFGTYFQALQANLA